MPKLDERAREDHGIMRDLLAFFRPKASDKVDAVTKIEGNRKKARLELEKAITDLSMARNKRRSENGI